MLDWTPVIEFGGSSTGITYAVQTGKYINLTTHCVFSLIIELSNKGTATGDAVITGLPVSAAIDTSCAIMGDNLTYSDSLECVVSGNTIQLINGIKIIDNPNKNLNNTNFEDISCVKISGTFLL